MRKTTEWLKKGTALVLTCALTFSTNFVYSNVKADETVPDGAKKAVHLTAPIDDGVYRVTINMMNANSTGQYSMGNAALRGSEPYNKNNPTDTDYKQLVVVKDGKATAVVQFMPMGYLGTYGFMMELEGVDPDMFSKYGAPLESYTRYTETQTITQQRTQDGKIVYDTYNDPNSEYKFDGTDEKAHKRPKGYGKEEQLINIVDKPYPSVLTVDVTPVTSENVDLPTSIDEYTVTTAAYCHVFVPVMFSISPSSGDQYARLLVDWKNAEKVAEPEKDLDYQLYRAMNVNAGDTSSEKYTTFTECKDEVVTKLENAWPNQHLDMNGTGFSAKPIINMKEMTDEEKATEAQKLNNAINAVEAEASVWDGTTVKEPQKDGNTLYIGEASELAWLSQVTNNGDTTKYNVELTNDIDLNDKPWKAIASFSGVFNGNGHKITNLNINVAADADDKEADQGLFKKIEGVKGSLLYEYAEVKDLTIEGKAQSGKSGLGSIAGEIKYVNVENVTSNVTINGRGGTGGLFGEISFANLKNCINLGDVQASGFGAGGITSGAYYSTFTNCGNEGNVTSKAYYVGGIVGTVTVYRDYADGITDCYNTGDITAKDNVGGIVGNYATYSKSSKNPISYIKNVYNSGNVTATGTLKTTVAGGIAGSITGPKAVIQDSYNGGKVSSGAIKGSIVAKVKDATLSGVYAVTDEGTPLYNVDESSTSEVIENTEYKDKDWFTSDSFKIAMGDNADKYECRESYINRGLPVFKSQEDTVEAAIREAKKYINRTISEVGYKGLSKTAVENIANESIAKIEQLTDKTAVGQEVSSAKEAIKAIPNDVNYGLDLTELKERVAYANSLDSSKYTEETWSHVEAALSSIAYNMEEGFGTQDLVNAFVGTLNGNLEKLELTPEAKELETAKENCNNEIKNVRENYLDTTKYTEESVNELKAAVEKAEALLQQSDATKEAIDQATEEIKTKVEKLVKKPEPTTEETTTQEPSSAEQTTKASTEETTKTSTTEETTKAQATTTQTVQTTTDTQPTTKAQETTSVKETVAKVNLKTVKNVKKKKVSVKWSKLDKVNGYQIRYSTNKNLKKAKTITTKKNVSTISFKAKKNRKYYVQIRAYIKTKDGNVYGKWSKVKATKVRK